MLLQVYHQKDQERIISINQWQSHKMNLLSEMQMLDSFLLQIQVLLMEDGKIVFVVGSQIYGQAVVVSWLLVGRGMWPKVCFSDSFFSHHILVAQKTNFLRFETIIVPYIIIYVVIGFLTLFLGSIFWLIPFFIVFFLALALRFHIIKFYQIQQNHCFVECLFGFFCCPCSISQSMSLFPSDCLSQLFWYSVKTCLWISRGA
jgi:hypothetical protein